MVVKSINIGSFTTFLFPALIETVEVLLLLFKKIMPGSSVVPL